MFRWELSGYLDNGLGRNWMRRTERWHGIVPRTRRVWLTLLFLALAVAGSAQEASGGRPKEMFQKVCASCHKPESVVSTRRTREQWLDTLEKMISKGLKATDEDLNAVLDYLVGQYGRVNVNRATADDIAEVLGLSPKEAEVIVKYRKDNGKFEDFDALSKVPGVDLKQLEKSREAVSF